MYGAYVFNKNPLEVDLKNNKTNASENLEFQRSLDFFKSEYLNYSVFKDPEKFEKIPGFEAFKPSANAKKILFGLYPYGHNISTISKSLYRQEHLMNDYKKIEEAEWCDTRSEFRRPFYISDRMQAELDYGYTELPSRIGFPVLGRLFR